MSANLKTSEFTSEHAPAVDVSQPLTIAVAGNPNAGKTSLFNALTKLRQKVANYPGVTVESKTGLWVLSPKRPAARVIDLPGLYSLDATSIDEQIARDILIGSRAEVQADVIVVVVDATNLARNLYLATQLIDTNRPVVIALTMFDLATRGQLKIDVERLSAALAVPVIPVVAKQARGIKELGEAVIQAAEGHAGHAPHETYSLNSSEAERRRALIRRYARIEQIVGEAVEPSDKSHPTVSERIDSVLTHKILGPVILLLLMLLVFQTIFSWANLPMNLIDRVFADLGSAAHTNLPPGIFTDLLADGILAGVGGVLVFLPQIFLLFFFISILEDSGYMARAAFLMDRLMRSFGLQGRAFMPLLSSFACAVPGIMATRTIENPKDRLTTILIAPFMSCSARLPVYTLMIAAFFATQRVFGVLSLGVLIIIGMYALGVVVAVIASWMFKRTILKAPQTPFVMELPPYRLPSFRNVAHSIFERTGLFVKKAGTVILAISILLWALAAFPRMPEASAAVQIENSFAGRAGRLIEPAIKPLGFDWRIGIGLISSFAARETIISTLSIVYNIGDDSKQKSTLIQAMREARGTSGAPVWTPLVAVSLMIFFLLACQCMSTVAIVRRETNSWRWPLFMVAYMLVLAYVASLVTYQGGHLLGFS